MTMFRTAIVAVPLLIGPAAALAASGSDGLELTDAAMRYLLPTVPAGGYFTLRNDGPTARVLTGASSPACGMLMLHRTSEHGGMESMSSPGPLPIPAGGTLRFAPGGYHLMCMQPAPTMRSGGSVPVTLHFEDGATLTAAFPVHGARAR